MDALSYVAAYGKKSAEPESDMRPVSLRIITNFTDDVLERILGGMCLAEGIYPSIVRAPYKQYPFALMDVSGPFTKPTPDLTFIFFDASPYKQSEFLSEAHRDEVLAGIARYANEVGSTVIASLFPLPYRNVYGHFFSEDPLFTALVDYNVKLTTLAENNPAIVVHDPAKLFHTIGDSYARDFRGHQAFDMPFSTDFLSALASDWLAYVRAILGLSRKCIVLDLDNTLWGGVVGEEGPLGIKVGPDYPGLAYQNFQRALLSLWERGVILAVASKNNEADVEEVFEKNPHMILKKEHLAAFRANWDPKSMNIQSMAEELNIGADSMVFIDDSPLERERMRQEAPHVLTPEWSMEPELYTDRLLALNVFHQMTLTDEDKKKGIMYAQEGQRRKVQETAGSIEEYITRLHIQVQVVEGSAIDVARASQLTQKTNQYNLTTRRYTESDILDKIRNGALVVTGEVSDTFGEYGIVVLAMFDVQDAHAYLDTFLMSCRVMGRGVEHAFLSHFLGKLYERGVREFSASFIPTAKNDPAASFLADMGFTLSGTESGEVQSYALTGSKVMEIISKNDRKNTITILE